MKKILLTLHKRIINLSLQRKLIFSYSLIIFLPMMIVGFFAYNIAAVSIKSQVSKYSSDLIQQVNDNIDNTVSELDRVSLNLATDKQLLQILDKSSARPQQGILNDEKVADEKINNMINLNTNIDALFIFSYNGEVYSYKDSNNSIKLDYIFTRTRWFENMKALNVKKMLVPTHFQDEVISTGHKKNVYSYVSEIIDFNTKKSLGNILIDVNADVFRKIWDKVNLKKYQQFIVIDNNKTIIYHSNEDFISSQFRSDYISKLLKAKNGSIIAKVDNHSELVTFNTSSFTNWTVITITPLSILYKNIINLQYIIIITVALSIFISIFVAVLLSKNITKPISELKDLMKEAEQGNLSVKIKVNSLDEIGELSLGFNNMITKINNLIETVYQTKFLKKEAELNALQAQINPHFLYNTLQIIDILAEEEGVDVICSVCHSLSRIFRYSINTGKEVVPLSDEIEHIKDYIYIHKLRFNNRFDVIYDIDEKLNNKKIIKLVLQPLVENAFFHGIENKISKSKIIISAKMVNDLIELTVEDTGIGMDEIQLEKLRRTLNEEIIHSDMDVFSNRSIGIKNVNARIRLYFGEAYGVIIDSKLNKGTKIKVVIPCIDHESGGINNDQS